MTVDLIDEQMAIFGYKTYEMTEKEIDNYLLIKDMIINSKLKRITHSSSNVNFLIKLKTFNNSKFMFKYMDLTIPYISEKDYLIYMWSPNAYEKIIRHIKQKNVFKIPIECSNSEEAKSNYLSSIFVNSYLLPPLIKSITISNIYPDIYYMHEIGHALINKKSCTENYLNSEIIPILFELIYGYTNYGDEVLEQLQLLRLQNLKDNLKCLPFDSNSLIVNQAYCVSTIKAFYIFDMYLSYDGSIREDIFKNISMVVNGKIKLEEFLTIYNASLENDNIINPILQILEKSMKTKHL